MRVYVGEKIEDLHKVNEGMSYMGIEIKESMKELESHIDDINRAIVLRAK